MRKIFFCFLFLVSIDSFSQSGLCLSCITPPATVYVDGTGTTDYLAKWITNKVLGNSQFQDNGTITGIGTSGLSAGSKFNIDATGTTYGLTIQNVPVNNYMFQFTSVGVLLNAYQTGSEAYFGTASANNLFFMTGGTPQLKITNSTGNIGIGTGITDASSRLEVQGTGTTSATYALKIDNASTTKFSIRDDGQLNYTGSTPTNGYVLTTDGSGNGTWATLPANTSVASGVYIPTLFNVANISSSTAAQLQYSRTGKTVTVAGVVLIDPTTTLTDTQLGMSLPIASNFSGAFSCGGTGSAIQVPDQSIGIFSDGTNDRVTFEWICVNTTSTTYSFTFTYLIE